MASKLKSKLETIKDLGIFAGMLTKEYLKLFIVKAVQSQLQINEAVVGLNIESIGDLKFHIVESDAVNFRSEVTEHYIDTNRAITDHVVKKPIEITLKCKVGIYPHWIAKDVGHSSLYYAAMGLVSSFIPKIPGVSAARKIKQRISSFSTGNAILDRLINSITSFAFGLGKELLNEAWHQMVEKFNMQPNDILDEAFQMEHKETEVFEKLYTLWKLSQPLEVVTFWHRFDNMIITNLRSIKEESDITEFQITLKQIQTTSSIITKIQAKQPRQGQASEPVNNGKTKGTSVPTAKLIPAKDEDVNIVSNN